LKNPGKTAVSLAELRAPHRRRAGAPDPTAGARHGSATERANHAQPEAYFRRVDKLFVSDGTRKFLQEFMQAFAKWGETI